MVHKCSVSYLASNSPYRRLVAISIPRGWEAVHPEHRDPHNTRRKETQRTQITPFVSIHTAMSIIQEDTPLSPAGPRLAA